MDFTHTTLIGELRGFYNGEAFCAAFHDDDMPVEWKQLEFILEKANTMLDFDHVEWYVGNSVKVVGLDRNQIIDLDCKLINFQFGNKIPLERQLQLVCEEK